MRAQQDAHKKVVQAVGASWEVSWADAATVGLLL